MIGDRAPQRTFFPELESLRGLAAISVVILHIVIFLMFLSPDGNAPRTIQQVGPATYLFGLFGMTLFNGRSAVTLFFVLSGFVMGVNMDTSRQLDVRTYVAFLIRRFFRLMPAIWVAIFFALILDYAIVGRLPTPRLMLDLLILKEINVGPMWTMVLEIAASLFYPAMLFFTRKMSIGIQLAGLFIAGCVAHFYLMPFHYLYNFNFPLYQFYLGLLVPTLGRAIISCLTPKLAAFLVLAMFVAYCSPAPITALIELGPDVVRADLGRHVYGTAALCNRWMDVVVPFASFYVIAWIIYGKHRLVEPALTSRSCMFLGRTSFSVYLLHGPITNAVQALLISSHVASPWIRLACGLALVIPTTLVLSYLSDRFVERPSIRAGKWWANLVARSPDLWAWLPPRRAPLIEGILPPAVGRSLNSAAIEQLQPRQNNTS
jgi:peptidoglycan/LPS O-acetylase OafA/YrhL